MHLRNRSLHGSCVKTNDPLILPIGWLFFSGLAGKQVSFSVSLNESLVEFFRSHVTCPPSKIFI